MKLAAEKRKHFMDPADALHEGLVAVSDDIDIDLLFEAYSFGIFPWPHEESPILWFSPEPRGVLRFADLHIGRTLRKFLKKCDYSVTFNRDFEQVMRECAVRPRPRQFGTWITKSMLSAYKKFHEQGYAHSVEVWQGSTLVGGLYGVYVAGVFSGESMFYKKDSASKVAILTLIDFLQGQGHTWMDVQMVTEHIQALGGKYVSREEYLTWLKANRRQFTQPLPWPREPRTLGVIKI